MITIPEGNLSKTTKGESIQERCRSSKYQLRHSSLAFRTGPLHFDGIDLRAPLRASLDSSRRMQERSRRPQPPSDGRRTSWRTWGLLQPLLRVYKRGISCRGSTKVLGIMTIPRRIAGEPTTHPSADLRWRGVHAKPEANPACARTRRIGRANPAGCNRPNEALHGRRQVIMANATPADCGSA